jgi:hypothetical protein
VLKLQRFDDSSQLLVKYSHQLTEAVILFLALVNAGSNMPHFIHLEQLIE